MTTVFLGRLWQSCTQRKSFRKVCLWLTEILVFVESCRGIGLIIAGLPEALKLQLCGALLLDRTTQGLCAPPFAPPETLLQHIKFKRWVNKLIYTQISWKFI